MAEMIKVEGVKATISNLLKVDASLAKNLEKGLVKAGLFLQRESQKIVPIDTGNLRASAFTRKEGALRGTTVYVGYTAHYAIYVHEDLNAKHKAGKCAKYLEKPAKELRGEILRIILKEMKQTTPPSRFKLLRGLE